MDIQKKSNLFGVGNPRSIRQLVFATLHRRQSLLLTFHSKIATFLNTSSVEKLLTAFEESISLFTLAQETFCLEPTNTFTKLSFTWPSLAKRQFIERQSFWVDDGTVDFNAVAQDCATVDSRKTASLGLPASQTPDLRQGQ